jgi:hypothetical protein
MPGWKEMCRPFGGHAYDGLMIAVDAIKRAGGTDKAKVRDAIEATKGFVGTGGKWSTCRPPTTWGWTFRLSACWKSRAATGRWPSNCRLGTLIGTPHV